jgi:hypothetical protein
MPDPRNRSPEARAILWPVQPPPKNSKDGRDCKGTSGVPPRCASAEYRPERDLLFRQVFIAGIICGNIRPFPRARPGVGTTGPIHHAGYLTMRWNETVPGVIPRDSIPSSEIVVSQFPPQYIVGPPPPEHSRVCLKPDNLQRPRSMIDHVRSVIPHEWERVLGEPLGGVHAAGIRRVPCLEQCLVLDHDQAPYK